MFGLLRDLRVVDLGNGVSGPYCAKLLCDAGATVVHVEPPDGDPSRRDGPFIDEDAGDCGAAFAFCNAGKQSVVLDYTTADGARRLWQLLAWADIVIENEQPGTLARFGFGADAVLKAHPSIVYVSITGYGQTGPLRDWKITELTIGATAGMVDLNGAEDREPIRYPGHVMGIWSGAAAAMGALAAWRHARRTGVGQHVDVSMLEAFATCHFLFYADYEYTGAIQPRDQRELIEASDGDLYLRWVTSPPWDEFAVVMDSLELVTRPELNPPNGMTLHADEIMRIIEERVRTETRQHWLEVGLEHGFLTGILQRPDEVFACTHLNARDFFDELAVGAAATVPFPGIPYTVDGERPKTRRTVPTLGQHTEEFFTGLSEQRRREAPTLDETTTGRVALEGLRILDNGVFQAGTLPARMLADLGAEIVRVENYASPEGMRWAPQPDGESGALFWEQGGLHHEQHRNKRYGVGLDVKKEEGREAFLRLAASCDVVLDNHPYDVFQRLGLTWEDLQRVNPDLVFVSTSGYGAHGPYAKMRALGMVLELATVSWFNGYRGEKPRRGNPPIMDHVVAYHIAFLILAAIEQRDRSGAGAWIDVAQYEVGVNLVGDLYVAEALGQAVERTGNDRPGELLAGCFEGAGPDRWLAVSVEDSAAMERVRELVGDARLDAGADVERLRDAVARWCKSRAPIDAARELQAIDVAASPVNNIRDLLLDDHLRDRDFFWLVDHAPEQERVGARAFPGGGVRLTHTPARLDCRAPMLGEHNRVVATTLMGYSEAEYESLQERGVFGTRPAAADAIPAKQDLAARTGLSAWSYPWKAREMDPDFKERLRRRFGRFAER
ncbi:MAG: Crotonobetainyl-CoA:carnitine CoA-transferase CaiB [Chloroflexi bacterium]|nr:MAG: Crotonobetainyl-CoA:carnitine CoA-transferase CaiB [Chloroflexota bacterium]